MIPCMNWLQAALLGLLQGLTEFLPVSSTAHMDIASRLMLGHDVGSAFSAVVQLGPIAAIIIYFWNDIVRYLRGIVRTRSPFNIPPNDTDARLGWYVVFGTLPLAIFGLLLEKKIDTTFRRFDVVAVALIVLAVIMLAAEIVGKRKKDLEHLSFLDSQVIGWAQVLALVPGASRSGTTITAGLFRDLDHESATHFSFLLSIPAITAAGLYKLGKTALFVFKPSAFSPNEAHRLMPFHVGPPTFAELGMFLFAALVAGIFAYIVTKWFMGYMRFHNTFIFIAYRILLGVLILALLKAGVLHEHPPNHLAKVPNHVLLSKRE
jgi:undecaprenyl-diphosphatase